MEFEFDKEMDALLRKAAKGGQAAAPALDSHLDADEISMFAENAMPDTSKPRVIKHLADCSRCRTILSNVIVLNREAGIEPIAETVAEAAAEPQPKTSWIAALLSTKALAFGFGALALLFVGFLGIGFLSNLNSGETQMAKADKTNTAEREVQPAAGLSESNSNNKADSNTNADSPDNDASNDLTAGDSNTGVLAPNSNAVTGKDTALRNQPADDEFTGSRKDLGRLRSNESKVVSESREESMADMAEVDAAPPPAPVSAPPAVQPEPSGSVLTTRGATVSKAKKEVPAAEKQDKNSDADGSGRSVSDARQVNGKNFTRKNGVWYDAAYKNQATTKLRRGTPAFTALYSGVRDIVNHLDGTVIVVWKSKAYRIQ